MKRSKVFAIALVAIIGAAAVGSAVEVVGETEHGTRLAPTHQILDLLAEQGFDVDQLDGEQAQDLMKELTRDKEVYTDLKALIHGELWRGLGAGFGTLTYAGDDETEAEAVYMDIAGYMWRMYLSEE